jgi:hypothetical protein
MKKFVVLLLMLTSCVKADDVPVDKRFVLTRQTAQSNQPAFVNGMWIAKDLKTGKEYLIMLQNNGYSTSIVEMQ